MLLLCVHLPVCVDRQVEKQTQYLPGNVLQRVRSKLIFMLVYWVASIFACMAVGYLVSDLAMQIILHCKDYIGLVNNCTLFKFNFKNC